MKYFLLSYLLLTFCSQANETMWHEADYVKANCQGQVEFVLADKTRIDCLTETHAIEYDYGKKWAEALGQALFYSAMTGKKAGIVLIVDPATKDRYLNRLKFAITQHHLNIDVDKDIWIIELHTTAAGE